MSTARSEAVAALARDPGQTALLVDFDGTLAPIVADPNDSRPLEGSVELLHRLAAHLHTVAVASGRPAAFLLDRLGLPGALRYFGLYGLESVDAAGRVTLTATAAASAASVARLAAIALARLPSDVVEQKSHSLALHWRRHPAAEASIRSLATELAQQDQLVVREAKMSLELLAVGAPDKGDVVRSIASGLGCAAFAGDDLGDLAAFAALDALSATGTTTVRIAVGGAELPEALGASADLIVSGPTDLASLLAELAATLEAPG